MANGLLFWLLGFLWSGLLCFPSLFLKALEFLLNVWIGENQLCYEFKPIKHLIFRHPAVNLDYLAEQISFYLFKGFRRLSVREEFLIALV